MPIVIGRQEGPGSGKSPAKDRESTAETRMPPGSGSHTRRLALGIAAGAIVIAVLVFAALQLFGGQPAPSALSPSSTRLHSQYDSSSASGEPGGAANAPVTIKPPSGPPGPFGRPDPEGK
jgi:hypothetical protein